MITAEELNELLKQEEIFNFIGIKFERIEKGYSRLTFNYHERLTRIGGILHGGVIFSAMDYAGSMAARSLDNVKDEVTVELKVNFLKPMKDGPFVVEAKVINEGKRIVTIEVWAYDRNKNLCAKALGTWVVYRF